MSPPSLRPSVGAAPRRSCRQAPLPRGQLRPKFPTMGADEQSSLSRKRGCEEELADGGAAQKRPCEEGSEGASLLGLTSYEDDEEEEAARAHPNGRRVEEEDEEDEEDVRRAAERRPRQVELRRDCPYLDTVNRQVSFSLFIRCLFV
jgi:hypothetical protein